MKTYKERRHGHIKAGTCITCNCRRANDGYVTCGICRERSNRWKRIAIQQRISRRLCKDCGKQIEELNDKRTCEPCKARRRRYANNHKARSTAYNRKQRADDFSAILAHYGNSCACCGEDEVAFLTTDHINNDGAAHRRSINRRPLYRWIVKNGFPEGFQILCWNCNCAKGRVGVCPHEAMRRVRALIGDLDGDTAINL